ncbi:MAG: SAM-dependent methyltransferase [Alistipes sp.]|nr:SAM-dependent methyltransferase [Alistipes sp.]MBQ9961765.1 SAM-dependent methyltransferase [Alistipes sp.]
MAATLYLIPCPISDETAVADVTPSANQHIIDSLDYFIVENTRSARRFLSKSGYAKAIDDATFVELNEHTTNPTDIAKMIEPLLHGRSAGVISEAGVPAVADPGQAVVELCHRHNIRVVPLVGPSSILMAVMASGLSGQSFAFNGYLPVKEPERSKAIKRFESRARAEHQSQLFIEAPYRNVKLLEQMLKILNPDTRLCIACDITSSSEYIRTQTVAQWRKSSMPNIQKRPAIFILL